MLPTTIVRLVLQRYWRVSRGLLLSVAAVIRDGDGRVLLCREAREASAAWRLPRRDVMNGEDVEGAFNGILDIAGLACPSERAKVFAIYAEPDRSRADHVALVTATLNHARLPTARGPLDWQWFAVSQLPGVIDPPSLRRIEEVAGLCEVAQTW